LEKKMAKQEATFSEETYKLTHMPRIMHPSYPIHRAVMLMMALGGIIAGVIGLISGESILDSVISGLYAGAAIFLTWALGREIDPDKNGSAFAGAGLAFVAYLVLGRFSILALAGMMVLCRMISRTVGLPLKLTDSLSLVILVGLIAYFDNTLILKYLLLLAFLLDGAFDSPPSRAQFGFGALGYMVVFVIDLITGAALHPIPPTLPLAIIAAVIAAATLVGIVLLEKVISVGDATQEPLSLKRVRFSVGFVMLAAGVTAVINGDAGIVALAPVWAALLGMVVYRVMERMVNPNPAS
jgi:hypothetical protein